LNLKISTIVLTDCWNKYCT